MRCHRAYLALGYMMVARDRRLCFNKLIGCLYLSLIHIFTQHMPAGFTASLAKRLDRISNLKVKEAEEGDRLLEGEALIAPGGFHLKVIDKKIVIDSSPKVNHVRPAIDVMLESLVYLPVPVIAVILTGMGRDGKKGVQYLKSNKKETVVVTVSYTHLDVYKRQVQWGRNQWLLRLLMRGPWILSSSLLGRIVLSRR